MCVIKALLQGFSGVFRGFQGFSDRRFERFTETSTTKWCPEATLDTSLESITYEQKCHRAVPRTGCHMRIKEEPSLKAQ
jgi:hypothetical protein